MLRLCSFPVLALVCAPFAFCESVWVSHVLGAELYEHHSTPAETTAKLAFGTELEVLDESRDPVSYDLWYFVEAPSAKGWLPAGYVDGRAPSGHDDGPLVAATAAVYETVVSGVSSEEVAVSSPLRIEYDSSDRFNGTGKGSTSVDAIRELEDGVDIPVTYDGQGWSREEPAGGAYVDTVQVQILQRLRHAEANRDDRHAAPIFSLHTDSLSCRISTGSHWSVALYFAESPEDGMELVGIRYTTIDPG